MRDMPALPACDISTDRRRGASNCPTDGLATFCPPSAYSDAGFHSPVVAVVPVKVVRLIS